MITYKATNTLNGKFYVGSTTDFEKRKKNHSSSSKNYPFQNALRKNPEAFEWEFVEDDSDEPILEQALLDMYFGTGQCYNLNPSASRPPVMRGDDHPNYGKSPSEEWRQAHSERMSGENHPFFGKKHTDETRQLQSEIKVGDSNPFFGMGHTDDWKQAQSERMSGENNPMFGTKRPEVSERMLGEGNPMYGKTGDNHPCFGKKRWVNAAGERMWQVDSPGPEWQNGIKWKEG